VSARCRNQRGQALVEFAMVVPMIVIMALGVIEFSNGLFDQHVVTKLSREAANLISRDATLTDGVNAMRTISSKPVNFDNGSSRIIYSVIKRGATTGTANYDKLVLYQRCVYGSYPGGSHLATAGSGSFAGAPNYEAANSDSNTGLQVTNVPADLVTVKGGMIYVAEIYSRHTLLTPLDRFGIHLPTTLYSIAYL
jgi:Flp pilus assembly protein TadG